MVKEDCGCGKNSSNNQEAMTTQPVQVQQLQAQQQQTCLRTFHQTATGVAEVVITPNITTLDIRTRCLGDPYILPGPFPDIDAECRFVAAQQICTEVDIEFGANAVVENTGIICGEPGTGSCEEPPGESCTYTLGFYRNNLEFTNEIINDLAGGEIVLGVEGEGLTIVVTEENASDILNFNPPTPPAPEDPPFQSQYAILYAQLLAANLNVLRTATCDYAVTAIQNANDFIANSPAGGQAGAPNVQEPLDNYNRGTAPGCPPHCS